MDLTELRKEIDQIDDELVRLFCRRMNVAAKVADYKRATGSPIYHPGRELEILQKVSQQAGPEMENYTRVLYSTLFELSRSYQSKRNNYYTSLYQQIVHSINNTPELLPQNPIVACQGNEGDYSQIACEKIFKNPCIKYFQNNEAVFTAIEQGLCRYGILPIETTTSTFTEVYDLIVRHNFSIIRTFGMKPDQKQFEQQRTTVEKPHTRFICISKNLEIYPKSDKTSVMMILPHKPGALYKVLARLYTLGININKLESRPIPDREFDFMFYIELETSIYSEEYRQLICELYELCEDFKYLGSYAEVVR